VRVLRRAGIIAWCLTGSTCVGHVPGNSVSTPTHTNYNRLTANDVAGFPDLYAAIRDLRPLWLAGRSGTPRQLRAFVNGVPAPWLQSLAAISADQVVEVRYLTAYEATTRFGALLFGNPIDGAIEVITHR